MALKFKRIYIAPNPRKSMSKAVAGEVELFLQEHGAQVLHTSRGAQLLVTIGGDGTVLHNKEHLRLPIFGIGSERSFICQSTYENWRQRLARALKRPKFDRRAMLACWLNGRRMEDALNEVTIRNREHRIVEFGLRAGQHGFHFLADGVIFATPTGSSAYAYSCGGKELKMRAPVYEIVAIAPYRRKFKPMVVGEELVARLDVETECEADLVVDGQFEHPLASGARVVVKKAGRETVFVTP